ncbi:glucokinase [Pleurocapsa sp. CCALA 161]|uniref:glucokinase n=1 Tax=Pleurocapsa sp. CCALA 161 TaxID=2107688 RepID=UPI0018EDFD82|nr:glucokinase [Pleurocapsa sp. CCALA 161]
MFLLAGDIGGTKTILRLVEVTEVTLTEKTFKTVREAQYVSASFPDLVPMVREFLAQDEYIKPHLACFAIAGPVVGNTCHLTNLSWVLDTQRLQIELDIPRINLLNDFAANSFGILGLKDFDVHTLQEGEGKENSPIAVIGAGTGLGEAFLVPQGKKYQIFASEGGHTDFAPRNDLEMELLKYLQTKLKIAHISVERVVSGQGIASIYQFLRDSGYAVESPAIAEKIKLWEQESKKTIDPAAIISQAAFKQSDRLCEKTMDVFIEAYGAETGNLALKLLSYGGIYIAGGIAAKILPLMQDGRFLQTFKDKGRVSTLIEKIPVHIVLSPQVGLVGSVLYALQHQD